LSKEEFFRVFVDKSGQPIDDPTKGKIWSLIEPALNWHMVRDDENTDKIAAQLFQKLHERIHGEQSWNSITATDLFAIGNFST
jgi:hypothetical protein